MASKLIALLLLLLCVRAEATVALVQTNATSTGATNATSLASGSLTFTAGNTIFVAVSTGSGASVWMTESSNIAWQQVQRSSTTGGLNVMIARGKVLTGFTGTITVNSASSAPIAMKLAEFSSTYALVLDQQTSNSTATTTTASSGTTNTTLYNNEFMIAALGHRLQSSSTTGTFASLTGSFLDVVSGTSTPTNTNCSTDVNTSNNDREVCLAYKIVTSTGTGAAGATVTGSNTTGGVIWTFYEANPSGFFSN